MTRGTSVTAFSHDAVTRFRLVASGKRTGKIVISIQLASGIESRCPALLPLVGRDGGYHRRRYGCSPDSSSRAGWLSKVRDWGVSTDARPSDEVANIAG